MLTNTHVLSTNNSKKKNDSLHTDLENFENTGEGKESLLILLLRHLILVMLLLIMNLILFLKEIY